MTLFARSERTRSVICTPNDHIAKTKRNSNDGFVGSSFFLFGVSISYHNVLLPSFRSVGHMYQV